MLEESLIQDKCGVFGIWGAPNAAEYVYLGLHNENHRGQEFCGIVTETSKNEFHLKHGKGIVNDAFSAVDLKGLKGRMAIGHVKYTTQGGSNWANVQPFLVNTDPRSAWVHNGEFANQKVERRRLQMEGALFHATSDTEIALHRYNRARSGNLRDRIKETFSGLKPSYSIVFLTENTLGAIRDPSGVRPLVLGKLSNGASVVASETVALDIIEANYDGEVNPGELVLISDKGVERTQLFKPAERLPCVFEHVYFARPDSFTFGSKVTNGVIREEFGRQLYREHPVNADVVIPVPDSSNEAALGFSEESYVSGKVIPFAFGIIRSHYIGRTFIQPTQAIRDASVAKKFNFNRSYVRGKRVVVVDDSIVRGTTMRTEMKRLRALGVKEIHLRIASPPYKHSCYLGINTPVSRKLLAHRYRTMEEIRQYLGVDSIEYLSQEGMLNNRFLSKGGFCTHCFDGEVKITKR